MFKAITEAYADDRARREARQAEEARRQRAYSKALRHPDPATRRWLTTHNAPKRVTVEELFDNPGNWMR